MLSSVLIVQFNRFIGAIIFLAQSLSWTGNQREIEQKRFTKITKVKQLINRLENGKRNGDGYRVSFSTVELAGFMDSSVWRTVFPNSPNRPQIVTQYRDRSALRIL